ncbi:LacI family DNA-binding transcriptional regulator [Saccharopolyspora sp. NPDC050642]|uniref:LacI family DNA-binding transcriptional regulator n=1 Tax=Saccharopolyspora sp. NPDC050642 TaxID=3157099 RepID=UPI0033C143E1
MSTQDAPRGAPLKPRRPATLRAIAEAVGSHSSTVSRVLNGTAQERRAAASPELAERIRQIAEELDYRPNPHAASLRTRRSGLIGVLVPRLSDLVLAMVYEGIHAAAADVGLSTFVTNTDDLAQRQRNAAEVMLARRVDGMIFGDAHLDSAFLTEFADRGVPFVLVNRWSGSFPAATCDDYLGGRLVAEHFLDRGFERAAVLAGPKFASTARDRTAGFVDRYREEGIEVPGNRIVQAGLDVEEGHQGADELLAHGPAPDAIFAVNDFAAIGAIGALRDHGIRAGEDLAVAGYHDTPLAAELPIPLTSVRTPVKQMGKAAVDMLAQAMAGETPESVRLPPTLVIRASTDQG